MEQWSLRVQGICKTYGEKKALLPVDEVFPEHSFTCIVGRSGCGKTTLLRLLCGLENPDAGLIELPEGKHIAPVFQEPRLRPWLNVGENITHEDLKAKYENGVLTIAVPKKDEIKKIENKTITIE